MPHEDRLPLSLTPAIFLAFLALTITLVAV